MKKYIVRAVTLSYYTLEVEAHSEDDATDRANDVDLSEWTCDGQDEAQEIISVNEEVK